MKDINGEKVEKWFHFKNWIVIKNASFLMMVQIQSGKWSAVRNKSLWWKEKFYVLESLPLYCSFSKKSLYSRIEQYFILFLKKFDLKFKEIPLHYVECQLLHYSCINISHIFCIIATIKKTCNFLLIWRNYLK